MLKRIINRIPKELLKIRPTDYRLNLQDKSLTKLLIHLTKFECSQVSRIRLADVEQRAVIAYFALLYIQQFQGSMYINGQLSIRQNLINRVIFQKFILNKVNSLFSHQTQTLNLVEIGLEQKNIDVVMCAFDLDKGIQYDQAIYSSARFSDSFSINLQEEINQIGNQNENTKQKKKFDISSETSEFLFDEKSYGKTVLHPFMHTGIILRSILQRKSRIIYGDKGIGKSFTYLLYSHLSSFIIESRIQNEHNNLQKYFLYQKLLTKNSFFYQAKKLFYIPIKILDLSLLQNFIQAQIVGENQTNLIKQNYKQISSNKYYLTSNEYDYYLKSISRIFRNRGVSLLLVVDEADYYYGLARRLFMSFQKESSQIKNRFLDLTKMLKYIQFSFQPFILNSSQDIQRHMLQDLIKKYDYFNFCDNGITDHNNIKIGYGDIVGNIEGVLQLYGLLFFEISKAMILTQKLNKSQLNILKQCIAKRLKNITQNSNSKQNSWKAHIRPLSIRQGIDQIVKQLFVKKDVPEQQKQLVNKTILIDILADQIKDQNQDAIWETLMTIKQKIEQKGLLSIPAALEKYLKYNFTPYSNQYVDHLIMGVRFCAFQLLDRPYKEFQVNLGKIIKIQNEITYLNSNLTQKYFLRQLLAEWTFANFNEHKLILEVQCSPREFIQRSQFLMKVTKQNYYNYDLLSKVYMKYKHMLTGFQFGIHLDWFASRLFRRGFCQLLVEQCSVQNNQLMMMTKNYSIQNGFEFQSLNRTKDINYSFKQLFSFAENNYSEKYQCAVADSRNNEGFDFVLCRKRSQSSPFQIITFDLTAGEVLQKVNKSTNEKKIAVGDSQHQLLKFFSNANLSNNEGDNEIDSLIKEIQDSLRQKIDISGLISLIKILSNQEKHKNIVIQIKKLCRINLHQPSLGKLIIPLVALELKQILGMTNIFHLLRQKRFGVYEQYTLTGVSKQLRIYNLIEKLYNKSPTDFIQNCFILIGQAVLFANMEKSFQTKKQIITFLRSIYSKQSQTNEFKYLIPEKLKGDSSFNELLQKHHYFVPFKNLRKFNKNSGLQWTHIIAVPEYQAQKYIKQVESSKKQFLFKEYTHIENGRVEKLKFKLASLKLDNTTLTFKDREREIDYEKYTLLKEQYGFIKTLMSIMMEKKFGKQ